VTRSGKVELGAARLARRGLKWRRLVVRGAAWQPRRTHNFQVCSCSKGFDHGSMVNMKQSRRMSLIEAIANVAIGYAVALLTQIIVFPLLGLQVSLGENLAIGALFTIASIARSYALRRVFEAIRARPSTKT
jgi:hypothetical protein